MKFTTAHRFRCFEETGRDVPDRKICDSDRGVALIIALMFLSFLTILGGALLTTTMIDIRVSDNYTTAAQTLYLAEAGMDQSRAMLRTLPSLTATLASTAGSDKAI